MARELLRRSHVLIVCGDEVDEAVKNDIAVAQRLGITATTLDGTTYGRRRNEHENEQSKAISPGRLLPCGFAVWRERQYGHAPADD